MKTSKIEKWLQTRGPTPVSYDIAEKLVPYLSDRKIDRQTSKDLLITDYFNSVDLAITTPGRNVLYAVLHSPLASETGIDERRKFIELLSRNSGLSVKLRKLFWKTRCSPVYSVNNVLFENKSSLFTREKLAMLLLVFVFLVIAIPLLFSQAAAYSIFAFVIISFLIFARNMSIYNTHIPGLIRLESQYYTARKIISLFKSDNINNEHIERLETSIANIRGIIPSLKILCIGTMSASDPLQLILFWVKNIFCIDLLAYNNAVNLLNRNKEDILRFYCSFGMIDAMLAVSVYLNRFRGVVCEAEFHQENSLTAENTYHPLIPEAVSNCAEMNGGMILTGSNMAGKSTFLRTIGLNTLLSQTIGFCYAERFSMPLVNLISIINKNDNLESGESFYFYEAKRISEMINTSGSQRYLFLIDELLSGTNSLERVSASIAIVKHLLSKNNIISLIATHDISIAEQLQENCECYYFSDLLKNDNMCFDYKLRKGIIKTTNAIRMLQVLGLPKEIISGAEEYIKTAGS